VFAADGGFEAGAIGATKAPQSLQNRLPDGLLAPHRGHLFARSAPQSPQNFLPSGLSPPQL
jgi:hypothetical protein